VIAHPSLFLSLAQILADQTGTRIDLRAYLDFILLGVIQGLTEFLPISSSGHLVLLENAFGFNPPGVLTEISLHLASVLAVIFYYFRDFRALIFLKRGKPFSAPKSYLLSVGFVTIVTALAVFPFRNFLETITEGQDAIFRVSVFFLVTALILIATDKLLSTAGAKLREASSLSLLSLLFIAIVQAISALPGISRSGSTIFAGVLCGLDRDESARFSFFLFVPIALIASAYELVKQINELSFPLSLMPPLVLGFIASLITGMLAISLLLKLIRRGRLSYFSIYLAFIAVVSFLTYALQ